MARIWSTKQTAVFSWVAQIIKGVQRHLVVRARAGTGKTTTITEALKHLPSGMNVLVAAFGNAIAAELKTRTAGIPGVEVRTLHSLGLALVKRFWSDARVNFSDDRERDLAERVCGAACPDAVKKLVAKLSTKGRLTQPHATSVGQLTETAFEFECEPDEEWHYCPCGQLRETCECETFGGFDLEYVEGKALDAMALAAAEKPIKTGIDGTDMLFLPVRNGWLRKMFDGVIVDEAQDMNVCQLEIAMGVSRGPIIVVGDDKQAIYAFAGADSGSLDRLKTTLNAEELPLNVTYRCAKSIVREAQRYVPDFTAGDDNPEGTVEGLEYEKLVVTAAAGDFILSRVNAPLVSIAMGLLRAGKRTRIAGQNVGDGLISLVKKMKARTMPELLRKIAAWEIKEVARIEARYRGKLDSSACVAKVEAVRDKAEMIVGITDGAPSITEVTSRIEALFTDDGLGAAGLITCSSVHRAKGLEAERVFVLKSTLLRRDNDEERNIAYVAVTRAKNTLVWVADRQRG